MESPLRGSKIFTRYHQKHVEFYRDENRRRNDDCVENSNNGSPTRKRADMIQKKMLVTNKRQIGASGTRSDPTSNILDDLTMGYSASPSPRLLTERDPEEYALSPSSARYFRIVSLDGCREEQVSPLFPDSSASSTSSLHHLNLPMIPGPIVSSLDGEDDVPCPTVSKRTGDVFVPKTSRSSKLSARADRKISDASSEKEATPNSRQRRRRSSHNRSQFVFDGNLSFGSVNSPPMYASPTTRYLSPTSRAPSIPMYISPKGMASLPDMSVVVNYPLSASLTMSPPPPFDIGLCYEDGCHEKDGRRTPPPTHEEQRRRNRAMPSMQYEETILNRLRQQEHLELRHQNTW